MLALLFENIFRKKHDIVGMSGFEKKGEICIVFSPPGSPFFYDDAMFLV